MTAITILTKYTSQGASSRYRYFLYINNLLREDTNIEIDSFLDTSYLKRLYSKQSKNKLKIILAYFKRFFVLANSADNLIIEYEALPYMPYAIERLFLKNKRYILNFDDNVWANYTNKKLLNTKYDNLVKDASGVIVANSYLEKKVSKLNQNVIKIPTVVDLESYNTEDIAKFDKFSLVWIGSRATYKFIQSHAHIFQKLSEVIEYRLVIIASKSLEEEAIDGVDMCFYDWSSATEAEVLKQAHIGIMPLDDDDFAVGKSSFKIIQYMATGIPTVASSIGENSNVLKDNIGFLADTTDEWIEAIQKLYNDKELYQSFCIESKKESYNYSMQKYYKEFDAFIKKTFD
jgi:glycosyltransferase involved in cell wall biosynthesis